MNKLEQAAQHLRKGWCRDQFRIDLPEGQTFCSMGALFAVHMGTTDIIGEDGDILPEYRDQWLAFQDSDEVAALDGVIREQYPEDIWCDPSDATSRATNIIEFNDHVAKHSDEVIAVFDKAAQVLNER